MRLSRSRGGNSVLSLILSESLAPTLPARCQVEVLEMFVSPSLSAVNCHHHHSQLTSSDRRLSHPYPVSHNPRPYRIIPGLQGVDGLAMRSHLSSELPFVHAHRHLARGLRRGVLAEAPAGNSRQLAEIGYDGCHGDWGLALWQPEAVVEEPPIRQFQPRQNGREQALSTEPRRQGVLPER